MSTTQPRGGQILDQSIKLDTPNQDVTGVLPVANGGTGAATQTLNNVLLGNGTGAFQNIAPGASGNVLKSDGTTWSSGTVPGTGDVVGPSASVDSEVALFSSTTGKLIKRASVTGIAKLAAGVLSAVTAPSGAIVGDTDTQTLTNKTLTGPKINQILDTLGNVELNLTATASSINYINIVNGITGTDVQLQAAGTDTNTGINLVPKGSGVVKANGVQVADLSSAQTLTNKTVDSTSPSAFNPAGILQPYGGRSAPAGWLMCDGSNVSRATYSALFAILCEAIGTMTVTIATPAVVTMTAHGLVTGDQVYLTTTGALPTGLAANTLYYAIKIDANSFNLATSRANAYAGTKIATSGTQSGVHTLRWCPYGLGDGSTTFTLPDFRGRTIAGSDAMGGTAANRLNLADALGSYGNIGSNGGEQRHTMTLGELVVHSHNVRTADNGYTIAYNGAASGAGNGMGRNAGSSDVIITQNTGSSTPFNLIGPTGVANIIIKT